MNISLPRELEKFVKDTINTGNYVDASEVVRVALERMKEQEASMPTDPVRLAELRRAIQIGIDQADRGEVIECGRKELGKFFDNVRAAGEKKLRSQRNGE